MESRTGQWLLMVVFGALVGLIAFLVVGPKEDSGVTVGGETTVTSTDTGDTTTSTLTGDTTSGESTTSVTSGQVRQPGDIPSWTVGQPWGTVQGLVMFRGNPTRTYYGSGPIADPPTQLWRYPDSPMCSQSTNLGETTTWCGMGWTGQPSVWDRPDGTTELIFGAYDRAIHFVDAESGTDLRPRFTTGDLIKGSVSLDPDGFPLLYSGSRDNKLRIIALDRAEPTELWSLDAYAVDGTWNDDWDSNPLIIDDVMYEGGENGWFFAYRLNRSYDSSGMVTVNPERLVAMPSYDAAFIAKSGPNVSVENSTVAFGDRVYFTNSGGRVLGLDVSDVQNGNAPVVFDFWAGGDIDATTVIDEEGMLYVSVNVKPDQVAPGYRTAANISRTEELGQLLKLDPYTTGDPVIWGIDLTGNAGAQSGTWATPALYDGMLYTNTHLGSLIAVDTATGERLWTDSSVGWHSWSSPVVVDDTLIAATCTGNLQAYNLDDPRSPARLWTVSLGESCLEATPAIWEGGIYIGSRDGYIRGFK